MPLSSELCPLNIKMAACNVNAISALLNKTTILKCSLLHVRHSRYGPRYMEPLFRKEDTEQPLCDDDQRNFQPIKASTNEETCSVFYDHLVQKFINMIMRRGKKHQATEIMHKTLANLKHIQVAKYNRATSDEEKAPIECNPLTILYKAVENCKPIVAVMKIPRGGVMYEVPFPCKPNVQEFKAITWILENCRSSDRRTSTHMDEKLAKEIMEAFKNQGSSVKNKQDLHKLCEANRAYAHFRWAQ